MKQRKGGDANCPNPSVKPAVSQPITPSTKSDAPQVHEPLDSNAAPSVVKGGALFCHGKNQRRGS
jgi:hypothetical protein